MGNNYFRLNPLWASIPLFLLVLCADLGNPLVGQETKGGSILGDLGNKSGYEQSEEGYGRLRKDIVKADLNGDINKLDDIDKELDRQLGAIKEAEKSGAISSEQAKKLLLGPTGVLYYKELVGKGKWYIKYNPEGQLRVRLNKIQDAIESLAGQCEADKIDELYKELQSISSSLKTGTRPPILGGGVADPKTVEEFTRRVNTLKDRAKEARRECKEKRVELLGLGDPKNIPKNIIDKIGEGANVSYCEENPCRDKQGIPNDPYFSSRGSWGQAYDDQWAIKHVGFTADKDSAWNIEDGTKNPIVVAVIDSGLDWNHQDVSWDNIWRNPKEIPDNGKDDDNNGYVDDAIGWNFMGNNNKPWDEDGHGTFVTGVIAATTNNGIGIAGINHGAKIMVLKALNTFGHSRASFLSEALFYAANNGARVINISVGGKHLTRTEQEAIDYAHSKGAVIVVASGNEAVDTSDYSPSGLKNVIAVSTTDEKDKRAGFSNWGQGISLAAPGMDVLSLRARRTDLMLGIPGIKYSPRLAYVGKDTRYYRASGSSFSAPIVSATASLIFAKNPKLTNTQVERMLLQSARDVEVPGWDQYTGFGLLDASAALQADPEYYLLAQIQKVQPVQEKGAVYLEVLGSAEGSDFNEAIISVGLGEKPEKWEGVVKVSQSVSGGRLGLVPATKLNKIGKWTVRLQATDKKGKLRESRASVDIE